MNLGRFIGKNLRRRPGRTMLTFGGVAAAMTIYVLVESLGAGLDRAMSGSDAARTMIVYRQNRYCPQTSFLPETYGDRIAKVPGVTSVLPVKVFLNNCRASLDVIAFQGAPVDRLMTARDIHIVSGDAEKFRREGDAALVGQSFATRRGLSPGDNFRFGNINVKVAGVFSSSEPVEESLILTHLDYLQRAGPVNRLGTVTEFEVKVDDAAHAKDIARSIDDLFRTAQEPTDTRSKLLFLESATRDLREILRFARLLGMVCVGVMLVLVGNTVVMSAQERAKENAVLRTLGFHGAHIVKLITGEALLLTVGGGVLGLALAWIVIHTAHLAIGAEGVAVSFEMSASLAGWTLIVVAMAGLLAAAGPAFKASRTRIVVGLRGA